MTANQLNVALVQLNPGDDKDANIAAALKGIDQAAGTGARLVMLPEVWTYMGPDDGALTAAEAIPGPLTETLAARARDLGIYLHAGSFLERAEGEPRRFNTTVVFDPNGEIIAKYRKIHLFDDDLTGQESYRESNTVAPGDEIVTVDIDGVRVGLTICYDLRFPELYRILALRGAEIIAVPAAFTMKTGRDHWEALLRARAIENTVYIVAPDQVGQHSGGLWTYGRSMIIDPWGTVLATAPDQPTVIRATLDLDYLRAVRAQVPSLANRMPDRYVWPDAALAGSAANR